MILECHIEGSCEMAVTPRIRDREVRQRLCSLITLYMSVWAQQRQWSVGMNKINNKVFVSKVISVQNQELIFHTWQNNIINNLLKRPQIQDFLLWNCVLSQNSYEIIQKLNRKFSNKPFSLVSALKKSCLEDR